MLNIRELHNWATSSGVYLSFFLQGSAVVPEFCCAAELTHSNSCFSPNLSPANFSKQFTHTVIFPFPHLCRSLLLFSSCCLVPASPHTNWATQWRWLWNLLHMGRVDVFYICPLLSQNYIFNFICKSCFLCPNTMDGMGPALCTHSLLFFLSLDGKPPFPHLVDIISGFFKATHVCM